MIASYCIQDYCIQRAWVLFLLIPLFFFLFYLINREFLHFSKKEEKDRFKKRQRGMRFFVLISRTIILFFLLLGLALPFTIVDEVVDHDPVVKVLIDSSASMEVFPEDTLSTIKGYIERYAPVEIHQIAAGTNSELGEAIIKNIEGNDNLLVVSDGNSNYGRDLTDVGIYAHLSGSTLFALDISPDKGDAWVEITGPSEAISGTPNSFVVNVDYVGNQPAFTLQIFVDDTLEFSGQNILRKEITKSFGEGDHQITARITLEDHFSENNVFYKTVKVVEKPDILFVSQKSSPIEQGISSIYDVDSLSSLPSSLSKYDAIVIDDVPSSALNSRVEDMTGYLLDGRGIAFIGGQSSFDKGDYQGTLLESMLPVSIGSGKIVDTLQHNVVIVLDVSDSFSDYSYTQGGASTALDFGKGIAIKMIEDFREDINVGVVAFANIGQIVSEPVSLSEHKNELIDKVKRLRGGEGTSIDQGLIMAGYALDKVKGTKNIVLISDGKMGHNREPLAPKLVAQKLSSKGVRIFTVGLASIIDSDKTDINRYFMNLLASIGNGNYFEPNEAQYLNVFFGKPEAKDQIFSGESNLAILDKEHFITNNLDLRAQVTGINFVVPKPGARSLIFTGDGNPVLNTWNFGLGRVITLATDDGSRWAGELLNSQNSQLITRMINYAVGDPERDKEISIRAPDGYLGEEIPITVRSDRQPVSEKLTFAKEGETIYTATFYPEEPGYVQFFDILVGVNPPLEYYGLGFNQELEQMAKASGGELLSISPELGNDIQTYSKKTEKVEKDMKIYPLAVALILFLLELIIRKLFEQRGLITH